MFFQTSWSVGPGRQAQNRMKQREHHEQTKGTFIVHYKPACFLWTLKYFKSQNRIEFSTALESADVNLWLIYFYI